MQMYSLCHRISTDIWSRNGESATYIISDHLKNNNSTSNMSLLIVYLQTTFPDTIDEVRAILFIVCRTTL
jgi:hypothetical protein